MGSDLWRIADEFYDTLMQHGYRSRLSIAPLQKMACLEKGDIIIGILTTDEVNAQVFVPYYKNQARGFHISRYENFLESDRTINLKAERFNDSIDMALKLADRAKPLASEARLNEYLDFERGVL